MTYLQIVPDAVGHNGAMDARDLFKQQLRTVVGPALRREGFAGSGSTWRKRSERGDLAIINVQKSEYGSANDVASYVNLAILPEPIWRFKVETGRANEVPQPGAHLGFWRMRLDPPVEFDYIRSWKFGDGGDASSFGAVLAEKLVDDAVPLLTELLDREVLLDRLRGNASHFDGGHCNYPGDAARVILLSADGRSAALDEALATIEPERADPTAYVSSLYGEVYNWSRVHAQAR